MTVVSRFFISAIRVKCGSLKKKKEKSLFAHIICTNTACIEQTGSTDFFIYFKFNREITLRPLQLKAY